MRYSTWVMLLCAFGSPAVSLAQAPAETPAAEQPADQKGIDMAVYRGIDWLTRRQCANCHFSVPDQKETTATAALKDLSKVRGAGQMLLLDKQPVRCVRDSEKQEQVTYLGVSLAAVPAALRRHVKLPAQMGLLVETVDAGSPAQAAGVSRHDVLLKIDEQWLVNPEQFTALIRTFKPAVEVKLTAIQRNESKTLSATLASREAQAAVTRDGKFTATLLSQLQGHGSWREGHALAELDQDGYLEVLVAAQRLGEAADKDAPPRKKTAAYLGVQTASPSEALAKQLRLAPGLALMIETVEENTAAARAGLKAFDILQKLDDQILVNGEQFTVLIRSHKPGDLVQLALIREGKPHTVRVALGQIESEVAAEAGMNNTVWRPAAVDLDGDVVSRGTLASWLLRDIDARVAADQGANAGQDAEFIRRIYLDILGVPPTAEEAKAFVEDTALDKRKKLLDALAARPEAISRARGTWATEWKDAQHALSLVSKDGVRHLTVQRVGDGKTLFDGSVDTPAQQQALPEDIASKLALIFNAQASGTPQAATAGELLDRILPRLELTDVPLKQALVQLREQTGANLVVNWKSLKQAGISADEPISLILRDVRAPSALSTLLALASDEKARLGYTIEGEVILIAVKGK